MGEIPAAYELQVCLVALWRVRCRSAGRSDGSESRWEMICHEKEKSISLLALGCDLLSDQAAVMESWDHKLLKLFRGEITFSLVTMVTDSLALQKKNSLVRLVGIRLHPKQLHILNSRWRQVDFTARSRQRWAEGFQPMVFKTCYALLSIFALLITVKWKENLEILCRYLPLSISRDKWINSCLSSSSLIFSCSFHIFCWHIIHRQIKQEKMDDGVPPAASFLSFFIRSCLGGGPARAGVTWVHLSDCPTFLKCSVLHSGSSWFMMSVFERVQQPCRWIHVCVH